MKVYITMTVNRCERKGVPFSAEGGAHSRDTPDAARPQADSDRKYSSVPAAKREKDIQNIHPQFQGNGNRAGTSVLLAGDQSQTECDPESEEKADVPNMAGVPVRRPAH